MGWVVLFVFLLILAGAGYLGVTGIHRVPDGRVGIVTKRYGRQDFDDDPRIRTGGAAGTQARTLRPNTVYWLPRVLYQVTHVPPVHVPNGTIGVVVAKAGAIRSTGSLARHVDCDYFQDGARFLRDGGEQGRQQQVLPSGYYHVNTALFDVLTTEIPAALDRERLEPTDLQVVEIPIGEVGVVITHEGGRPEQDLTEVGRIVDGHGSFQHPWVFVAGGGQRGVQAETLDEGGRYAINPWFARVVRMPTRVLILEWVKQKKAESNLDASLDQVVLDVQGHTVRLNMKQTFQIPIEAAPRLVRQFGVAGGSLDMAWRGPVREFVQKVVAPTVEGYFRRISAHYRIQEFITQYDEVCNELATEVRQALAPVGIEAVTTTLEEFECDHPEINELRRRIALQQEMVRYEEARLAELRQQQVNEQVVSAIERQRIQVERERKKLEVVELQTLIELLGPEHMRMERILERWVRAQVPQVISGVEGNVAEALLQLMPFSQARDTLLAMAADSGRALGGEDKSPELGGNGHAAD